MVNIHLLNVSSRIQTFYFKLLVISSLNIKVTKTHKITTIWRLSSAAKIIDGQWKIDKLNLSSQSNVLMERKFSIDLYVWIWVLLHMTTSSLLNDILNLENSLISIEV